MILRRRLEPAAQVVFVAVAGEGDAFGRADIDAGIAFDAGLDGKYRLDVAVEAALGLGAGHEGIEAQFKFELDVLQGLFQRLDRHLLALFFGDLVVVTPLVNAHLLADEVGHRWRTILEAPATAEQVDGNRRLVTLRDGGDDVLRAERGIAAEKHLRQRRLQGRRVQHRHAPLVEFEADVLLDPREGVFLADGDQDFVAFDAVRPVRRSGSGCAGPWRRIRRELSRTERRSACRCRAGTPSAPAC